jgi:hypothetical protein
MVTFALQYSGPVRWPQTMIPRLTLLTLPDTPQISPADTATTSLVYSSAYVPNGAHNY